LRRKKTPKLSEMPNDQKSANEEPGNKKPEMKNEYADAGRDEIASTVARENRTALGASDFPSSQGPVFRES